jgi:hypothetical protein
MMLAIQYINYTDTDDTDTDTFNDIGQKLFQSVELSVGGVVIDTWTQLNGSATNVIPSSSSLLSEYDYDMFKVNFKFQIDDVYKVFENSMILVVDDHNENLSAIT